MSNEDNNLDPSPSGDDIVPEGGNKTASEVVNIKDVLNEALGKDYKDNDSAIKSIKDTFDFVGKAGKYRQVVDTVMKQKGVDEAGAVQILEGLLKSNSKSEIDPSNFVSREELEERDFFSEKPELASQKELIKSLAKAEGKKVSEIVEMDKYKTIFEKVQKYDASEKSKSVLHSNPRLGKASSKLAEAQDARKAGNMAQAKSKAVEAVLEATGDL